MDDELRALERLAATDPAQRLRLAAALVRAGRHHDVFEALRPGLADPAVRAAVVRLPAWTHPWGGDAGATRWLDVRPVRRTPRVRWQARTNHGYGLVATALGVVLVESADEELEADEPLALPRVVVLDQDTGARRWQLDLDFSAGDWGTDHAVVRDDVLMIVQGRDRRPSFVCDLASGERLFDLPRGVVKLLDHELLLVAGELASVRALDWPEPRSRPDARSRWQVEGLSAFASGGDLVLGRGETATLALDRATGVVRWEVATDVASLQSPRIDAAGALVTSTALQENERPSRRRQLRLRSVSPSGEQREVAGGSAELLSPTHYLHAGSRGTADGELLAVHERGSGRALAEVSTGGWVHGTTPLAGAGDVIYTQLDVTFNEPRSVTLAGVSFGGDVLWRSTLDDLQDAISEVVAYPGRVYALACDGTLLCLEEPG